MWMSRLRVRNLKSFEDSGDMELGPINIMVGRNNSGKSTILRAVQGIQRPGHLDPVGHRRFGGSGIEIQMDFKDFNFHHWRHGQSHSDTEATLTLVPPALPVLTFPSGGNVQVDMIPDRETQNFLFLYTSKRKVIAFDESVNLFAQQAVSGDLRHLVAKIDRVSNPHHPAYPNYVRMCTEAIGFVVTTFASENGKKAGIFVNHHDTISLDAMGEGVTNLVGLIAELCTSTGKCFVIEELENDVHPKALKALLHLVEERSSENQFLISTHSNIVLRHLGAIPSSRIFQVNMRVDGGIPTSTCTSIGTNTSARVSALQDLGYELHDFDIWDGWLILEESSAERIIRDLLIPWFAPKLTSVRTLAVNGVSRAEPTFEDFRRLFLFAHLELRYQGRAWVVLDGDDVGKEAISRLQSKYPSWHTEHFSTWTHEDFEQFYPSIFESDRKTALSIENRQGKRDAKEELLKGVLLWAQEEPDLAKKALEVSAAPVIEFLLKVQATLFPAE